MRTILTALFMTFATQSLANPFIIFDNCDGDRLNGFQDAAKEWAFEILLFTPISNAERQAEGIQCVSYAFGGEWAYNANFGTYVPVLGDDPVEHVFSDKAYAEVLAMLLLSDNPKAEKIKQKMGAAYRDHNKAALDAIASAAAAYKAEQLEAKRARENENRLLIAKDVREACTKLYFRDKSAAILNQVCLDSFSVNGHPLLGD